ncbi:MAG: sigma-54-dependent Fis family transcriptional regulator [Deltaproteobacteria bacterium]|nr:sigma-54-dependent Fis family transcriptional regulator [Deltaproteobacteria bacterium]MBW2070962.1 sigma-54-dependent Fis family transcriptional regulator [Deltaproteobacteria bacterium]
MVERDRPTILIVDDEPNIRQGLAEALQDQGYHIEQAASGEEALQRLEDREFHLALVDLVMDGMDGIELLQKVKQRWPRTEVVIITAHGTIETAVRALKEGAYDYLTKPVNVKRFRSYIHNILRSQELEEENRRLREQLRTEQEYSQIIGRSDSLLSVLEMIEQLAPTEVTVLIEGESGTGKELVARALHQRSGRGEQPFISVNCGAIPKEIMGSELFGHERGAFTGATAQKKGRFELAHKGTLFLDEIAEMDLEAQVTLLRILEEGKFRRLGGTREIAVDVRVVAATNKSLTEQCRLGLFREDLYYRLNVARMSLPPLRERREDIPLLSRHFLETFAEKYHKPGIRLSPEVQSRLATYEWPGNIRELRNCLERAVILARGPVIDMELLPERFQEKAAEPSRWTMPVGRSLAEMEREMIRQTLQQTHGHRKETARILGISERDLYYKLKKYKLK